LTIKKIKNNIVMVPGIKHSQGVTLKHEMMKKGGKFG